MVKSSMKMAVAAAAAAMAAVGTKAVFMAAKEEKVSKQTAALLEKQGVAWDDVGTRLDGYLKDLEKLTSYNDTDLQLAFNEPISQGLSYSEALDHMNAVTSLACSKNIDLGTSAQLPGRAFNGH